MGSYANDPIADLLTRIRNAGMAKKRFFDIDHSKIKENIISELKKMGYIAHFLVKEENKKSTIRVFLKYSESREHLIHEIKRISKSSVRKYIPYKQIPVVRQGLGAWILTTSRGVMNGDSARKLKVGGEVLCEIW